MGEKLQQGAVAAAQAPAPAAAPAAGAKPAPLPFDIARFAGIFAAVALPLGAIGGAIGSMLAAFASLAWWQIPLAILGILLAISGPSMLIALLKLRQRTLGPLLEGAGWAINGRVRITFALGRVLTGLKRLPPGARRSGADPFAGRSVLPAVVLGLLLAGLGLAIWWWWPALQALCGCAAWGP